MGKREWLRKKLKEIKEYQKDNPPPMDWDKYIYEKEYEPYLTEEGKKYYHPEKEIYRPFVGNHWIERQIFLDKDTWQEEETIYGRHSA